MTFFKYCKDKKMQVLLYFIIVSLILSLLIAFKVNSFLFTYISILLFLNGTIIFIMDYGKKKSFYQQFIKYVNELDQKYLIIEMLEQPDFLEGEILYQGLMDINKSLIEQLNQYKFNQEEFKEYIEMWIHEVKTPISSSKLIIENNQTKATRSINEEMDKIEELLDQILYYIRSNNVEKDYLIRETDLDSVIKKVLNKNKKYFIEMKLGLDFDESNLKVMTDSKWLEFILNQIIQNSIKYVKGKNDKIIISSEKNRDSIMLKIEDHGIGIIQSEIGKVFDKCFTGTNGRLKCNSTGMGLYICKKLCQKLGHEIFIQSDKEQTIVKIIFPKSSYNKM